MSLGGPGCSSRVVCGCAHRRRHGFCCVPRVPQSRAAGPRAVRRRPVEPGAPGSVCRFVAVRHRSRAVVRKAARSYLRGSLRYDRAPSGTTARFRVRPRASGYDRAPSGTTARPRVRPRAPGYDRALPGTTAQGSKVPNHRHSPTPTAPSHMKGQMVSPRLRGGRDGGMPHQAEGVAPPSRAGPSCESAIHALRCRVPPSCAGPSRRIGAGASPCHAAPPSRGTRIPDRSAVGARRASPNLGVVQQPVRGGRAQARTARRPVRRRRRASR